MIPKVIHYCWFGRNALPEMALKCIESWKKFFPEYEIKEWNEDNFDIESCDYVREAYGAKKWAFVSDYARFKIIFENGGIYFDTDVEIINYMNDIIEKGAFFGRERVASSNPVNAGLGFAAEAYNPIYEEIIKDYEESHFIDELGNANMMTVVERVTQILQKHGLRDEPIFQNIEGISIYPNDFFCPFDYNTNELKLTNNTRTIHWYDASWLDKKMQKRRNVCIKLQRRFRGKIGERLSKIYTSISYYWEWICTGNYRLIYNKVKERIKK